MDMATVELVRRIPEFGRSSHTFDEERDVEIAAYHNESMQKKNPGKENNDLKSKATKTIRSLKL